MIVSAYILTGLSLLMGVLLIVPQPKFPASFWLLLPKLPAGAFSPYWAVIGAVGAVIGLAVLPYPGRSVAFFCPLVGSLVGTVVGLVLTHAGSKIEDRRQVLERAAMADQQTIGAG